MNIVKRRIKISMLTGYYHKNDKPIIEHIKNSFKFLQKGDSSSSYCYFYCEINKIFFQIIKDSETKKYYLYYQFIGFYSNMLDVFSTELDSDNDGDIEEIMKYLLELHLGLEYEISIAIQI